MRFCERSAITTGKDQKYAKKRDNQIRHLKARLHHTNSTQLGLVTRYVYIPLFLIFTDNGKLKTWNMNIHFRFFTKKWKRKMVLRQWSGHDTQRMTNFASSMQCVVHCGKQLKNRRNNMNTGHKLRLLRNAKTYVERKIIQKHDKQTNLGEHRQGKVTSQ